MVAKAANGNCIHSVMYFAYLSNNETDYSISDGLISYVWSDFFCGPTEATKDLTYRCAVS